MDDRPFIPEGIDQDSWLGFEQRIQQRRFSALVDAARQALAAGDRRAAREALAEARALNPEAAELTALDELASSRTGLVGVHLPRLVAIGAVAVVVIAIVALREPAPSPDPVTVERPVAELPPPAATTGESEESRSAEPTEPTPRRAVPDAPAPALPSAPPPPPAVAVTDEDRVRFALTRYARTFTGFTFDDCALAVNGTTATAVCRSTRISPAVPSPIWDVELSQHDEGWMIDSAVAREK